MTKREKERIMQVVRDGIEAGELQAELHREIAPLLNRNDTCAAIVRRGAAQNVRTVVASPVTVVRWVTQNFMKGYKEGHKRGVAIRVAHAEKVAKAKAERAKAAKAAMRRAKPRKATGKRKPAVAMA